nr:longitudinals lacking protein-like [Maniola hyperantus]
MMAQPQYSLSWEDHPKNICNGLSYLQQSGEFVDMTLAADGHLVKVHQVIMALSSPYLKDLIASAQCPHPVIVLNKISHTTLSAILEYIYSGEVLVAIEDIRDLIDAAKELHIKGLQEMDLSVTKPVNQQDTNELILPTNTSCLNMDDEDTVSFEIHRQISPTDDIYRPDK